MQWSRAYSDAPIRRKLIILVLITSVFGIAIAAPAWIFFSWNASKTSTLHNLDTTSRVIAENTTAAIAFSDVKSATEILAALRAKPEVSNACLYRVDHGTSQLFAVYPHTSQGCPEQPEQKPVKTMSDSLQVTVPVILGGEQIGKLQVTQGLQRLRNAVKTQIQFTLLLLTLSFVLSFFFALRIQGSITRPIQQLAEIARRVSETKNYHLRVPVNSHDELGQLSSDFNNMLDQISRADQEVQRARVALAAKVEEKTRTNIELEQTMERLRSTQAQLVQSEKMASLGALVAGVAHEINTPIGIGVTAASTLQAKSLQIKQQYEKANLSRSDLEQFLNTTNNTGNIILSNLERAANLIQSFKLVAVDQSNNERRVFFLDQYIAEVLQSLAPKLKHAGDKVIVNCPTDLQMDSYPGAIAQILTNFVSNSLLHAYDEGQQGNLRVDVQQDNEHVILRCSDDGKGVPAEILSRIFDPFFTTKRGSGGTGLGLHIVYNLVTSTLGGTIRAESTPGQGLTMIIRIPRVTKEKQT